MKAPQLHELILARKRCQGARLRGRTHQGGVLGTFRKPTSGNPLLRTPSENAVLPYDPLGVHLSCVTDVLPVQLRNEFPNPETVSNHFGPHGTVSSGRITSTNIIRPKSVKNCLDDSQNHFRSVNWTSVILHFQILQTLRKPKSFKYFQGGS